MDRALLRRGRQALRPASSCRRKARALPICALAAMSVGLLLLAPAGAEEAGGRSGMSIPLGEIEAAPPSHGGGQPVAAKPEPPLPEEATTRHSLALPDRTLTFTVKAGAAVFEDQGAAVAEIGYFAYLLDNAEPRKRPITFAINGGPGSASAWLHVGALGPWRLPINQAAAHPTAPADVLPNADTWLDFTDLVFIDPVGTGYSRLHREVAAPPTTSKEEGGEKPKTTWKSPSPEAAKAFREKFWSVQGDLNSIVTFIKHWLEANGRVDSPKLILGESYGGFRAPRIAQALQGMPGFAPNAIILVSPALSAPGGDLPGLSGVLTKVSEFPSVAAAVADTRGPVSAEQLLAFEREATGGYLADLMEGPRDQAAIERLAARVAAATGLGVDAVSALGPRSAPRSFLGVIDRKSGRIFNHYDATEKRDAAYDGPALVDSGDDLYGPSVQLARAMAGLVRDRLGWKPAREYRVRGTGWAWSGQESATALRSALVRDPTFRVLIVHGYADLVVPYFRTKLILSQMPVIGADNNRVRLQVYRGGHMLYSRDDSRVLFRKDALQLYEAVAPESR